jgi:glycosyltransferase involved in cell wall biosynthesis
MALVSIIVPCYNYGNYIPEALASIREQTYPDWECIIVDDGSTDNSREVIEAFIENDQRFRLIKIANSGVSTARNTGVAHSKGSYLFPLDADNKMHPDCLTRCMAEFAKAPETRLVYTEAELFGAENGRWDLPEFDYKTMLKYNMVDNSSLFLRKDFDRVGGYRTNMVYGLEDWDFFIALLHGCRNEQVIKIKEPLYYYRVNNAGRRLTVAANGRQKEMLDLMVLNNFFIYQEYFPGIFGRIHDYEFDKTILSKGPVKFVANMLIRLSALRNRLSGNKNQPSIRG